MERTEYAPGEGKDDGLTKPLRRAIMWMREVV